MEKSIENMLRGRRMKRMVELNCNEIRKRYGLKQVELDILFFMVTYKIPVTPTEICNKMILNKGQVSRSLLHLTELGYLENYPDQKDKRVVWYQPLKKAMVVGEAVLKKQEEMEANLCEGISQEEMDCFYHIFEKLLNNIDKHMKF